MSRFGLIGRQLGHSFSPMIHGMIGDYDYRLYPLEPEELKSFVETTELDGFNVTIPYKIDVMSLCKGLTPRAASIGSVNTMLRLPDCGFLGDNTDYDGFRRLLGEDAENLRGCKALVLGSGGAAHTVCAVLADAGIPATVISRGGENNYNNLSKHSDAALIVNTTPVGMHPNNGLSPVDLRLFPACCLVLDVVYKPDKTALLLQAEALGIPARNGLLMLTAQAVRAAELFLGSDFSPSLADEIAERIRCKTRSVTIIGMPGSGKSTVASCLGNLTGRRVIDMDQVITEQEGMSPAHIITEQGEQRFRQIETGVLSEISKLSGVVISTGGGIVTVPENRDLIRQNSVCLLLERDQSKLDTADRPLSQMIGLEELGRLRGPLYKAWSERTYQNIDSLYTAIQIMEDYGL
jgi:shikimate dehydrogenase